MPQASKPIVPQGPLTFEELRLANLLHPHGSAHPLNEPLAMLERLDDEMLREIADLLGIPQAERSRIISGEIIVGPPPVSPSGTAPPTPPSGAAPPTPPSGRRRQRK